MAVLGTPKRGKIGPSLKGLFYSYQRNGTWVLSIWPKKTSREPTPDELLERQRFRAACDALKRINPWALWYARTNAWGTPMLPRDALMAMLYGRGPNIITPDGEVIRPMAARLDISMLLDNIAWKPGSIMFRGENTWLGLDGGAENQVLTYNPFTKAPEWRDPSGSGTGAWSIPAAGSINNNLQGNCLGKQVIPMMDMKLRKMVIYHRFAAADVVRVVVCRLDAGEVVQQILTNFVPALTKDGTDRWDVIELPNEVPLLSGQKYALMICRVKTGWGVDVIIGRGAATQVQFPIIPGTVRYRQYDYPINIGDTLGAGTDNLSIGYEVI